MLSKEELMTLAAYWTRADMMHEHLHEVRAFYAGNEGLRKEHYDLMIAEGVRFQFETYLGFWLAALFVAAEGFNKLKLRDEEVRRLFKSHLNELKVFRRDTYHFTLIAKLKGVSVIEHLHWAEELHDAIGKYLRENIDPEMLELLRRKKLERS
jgi:hypothetical protein